MDFFWYLGDQASLYDICCSPSNYPDQAGFSKRELGFYWILWIGLFLSKGSCKHKRHQGKICLYHSILYSPRAAMSVGITIIDHCLGRDWWMMYGMQSHACQRNISRMDKCLVVPTSQKITIQHLDVFCLKVEFSPCSLRETLDRAEIECFSAFHTVFILMAEGERGVGSCQIHYSMLFVIKHHYFNSLS